MEYTCNVEKKKENKWVKKLIKTNIKKKSIKKKAAKIVKNKKDDEDTDLFDAEKEDYKWKDDLLKDLNNKDEKQTCHKVFARWNFTGRCIEFGLDMLPPGVSKC